MGSLASNDGLLPLLLVLAPPRFFFFFGFARYCLAGMRAVLLSNLAMQAIRERRAVAVPVDLYEPVFA